MRPIRIESTKYDGSKHYRLDATVVRESADEIHAYTPPGLTMDTYRGQLATVSHTLRIFWPDRDWNLFVRWRPDWSLENYYVNICTPAVWNAAAVTWTDLDLDLILRPQDAEPLLDDAEEFESHSLQWQYPTELVERCWATVEHVGDLMRRRASPFDGGLAGWRMPGESA